MTARVLLVDDEAPARRKLARYLSDDPRFVLAGEAQNGAEAVERIVGDAPDLVFLDIRMPAFDGFEVLASVPRARLPHVIFTTAYAEFAVRAFEVRAVDYLMKPFDQERFRAACDAYWERRRVPTSSWEAVPPADRPLARLLVRHRGSLLVVHLRDIVRVSAEEKYVRLHTTSGTLLHRMPIGELASRLDASRFVRVQRSQIVSLAHVAAITPRSHGDALVRLVDGTEVLASRHFREEWSVALRRGEDRWTARRGRGALELRCTSASASSPR